MSKHTPGPWAVFNSTDVFTTSRQGRTNDGYQIADCAVDWHSVEDPTISYQEMRANAHLIAAAPDLLEALVGLVAVAAESTGVAGYHLNGAVADWDEFEEVAAAIKAIAKATGEAQ